MNSDLVRIYHYDDGKGNSESHECGLFLNGCEWDPSEICGYGETQQEALDALEEQVNLWLEKINKFRNLRDYEVVEVNCFGKRIEIIN